MRGQGRLQRCAAAMYGTWAQGHGRYPRHHGGNSHAVWFDVTMHPKDAAPLQPDVCEAEPSRTACEYPAHPLFRRRRNRGASIGADALSAIKCEQASLLARCFYQGGETSNSKKESDDNADMRRRWQTPLRSIHETLMREPGHLQRPAPGAASGKLAITVISVCGHDGPDAGSRFNTVLSGACAGAGGGAFLLRLFIIQHDCGHRLPSREGRNTGRTGAGRD